MSGVGIFEWRDRMERWRKFAAHFESTAWADGLRGADITRALAVAFLPEGRVGLIESRHAEERDFCLGISAAIYVMHCTIMPSNQSTQ
jgi:hypothetical protein